MKNVRKSWVLMTRILVWEGADPRVSGVLFKAVVHVVLLFRSDTLVLTPRMEWDLGSFQHRVARRITGMQPRSWG